MCQDLKIREEDDLENESMQNVLKQPLIIRKVLESLDFPTLQQCRAVSKSWGKEATLIMSKKCKVTFKNLEAIEEFLTLPTNSEPLFVHVSFKFEVEQEAKSSVVQRFFKIHALQLHIVETPDMTVNGCEPVNDWINKLIEKTEPEPKPIFANDNAEEKEALEMQQEIDDIVSKEPEKLSESEPAILDENENAIYGNTCADDNGLQEIVIHDENEEVTTTNQPADTVPVKEAKKKSVHFSTIVNPDYVPIPYCDEGYDSFDGFYPYYLGEHSHETGRRLHILGITNSIILILLGTFTLTPILYVVAFIQAYVLAVGAHYYFDKHIPKPTIKNPIYMVMGNLKMWWEVASGQRAL